MNVTLLTRLGILEIAFSAVILPAFLFDTLQRTFQNLVKDRKQLLQAHLDYFFMGILMILAGSVLWPIPDWIVLPLVFGSLGNPTVFLINSLAPDLPNNPIYRIFILLTCASVAFAWAAMGVRAVII